MHNRHNLHFLAVTEEISPGLHPVPVRSPKVVSLESTLRKVVVQATTPDDDNVRTERLQHLEESRLGVTEILLRRSHTRTRHRYLNIVVEGDAVPEALLVL